MSPISRSRQLTTMNPKVVLHDIFLGSKRKRNVFNHEKKQDSHNNDDSDYDDKQDSDNNDDSDYDDEVDSDNSDDSDYDPSTVVKKSVVKKKVVRVLDRVSLSAYEEMIEKKRSENMELLKFMEIDTIKAEITEAFNRVKKPQTRPRSHFIVKKENVESIRRSQRLEKFDINLSERSLRTRSLRSLDYNFSEESEIPSELPFKDALKSNNSYEKFVSDFSIQEEKSDKTNFLYNRDVLNSLSLLKFNVCKVVPARVTALSWYSSVENLIVAAGDKYGYFGLWNIQDAETTPYLFRNHSGGITNMQFNLYNPVEVISSSYDGTFRCSDLVKHMFTEIYNVSDETCCTYFDFLNPRTYLVSQMNGEVALVDRRTRGKVGGKRHKCHDYTIRTVNVHPVNKNIFITADNKGFVRLWDLRKLQTKPVTEINYHKRCVNSAYFSPVTGNSILTTSLDNTICIFDSTNLMQDMKLEKMMKHNNNTGRWLSKFKATWLPNSDDIFAVGRMSTPTEVRKIEIFDNKMNNYCTVVRDYLTTITSLHQFHPHRSALAAANSSGKLFIFT